MKLLFLAVLTSLLSSTAFTQTNFQSGYVILADGERIEGYLNFQDREKNPREAVFRTAPEGESRVYLPIFSHSHSSSQPVAVATRMSILIWASNSPRVSTLAVWDSRRTMSSISIRASSMASRCLAVAFSPTSLRTASMVSLNASRRERAGGTSLNSVTRSVMALPTGCPAGS